MKIRKADVIWTYLAKIFTLGVNIILLPLIMRYLSDTDLGLWYVFASISQVVNLFDFGFNATISRHMTYAYSGAKELQKVSVGEYSENQRVNCKLMAEVIATCKIVYLLIAGVALITMSTIGTAYILKVIDNDLTREVAISWLVYMFAVFFNLLYGYWSSLLHGIGAVAERNRMAVYSKIIQIILAFVLLKKGYGLLGFVIAYAISGITLRVIGKYFFDIKTKGLELKEKVNSKEIKKCFLIIWATAWKDGIVMLAQYLATQANTLVSAYYLDLSTTSSYGVITQIGSIIAGVAGSYYLAYQPQYSNYCLREEHNKIKELTCTSDLVYKILFGIMTMVFLLLGIPLLKWIRPTMNLDIYLIFEILIFYYLYNQHTIFCSMIAATNRILYYKHFIVTAIISFLLSVFFVAELNMGVRGLVFAQLLANLVFNNWYWPMFVMKEQKIKYWEIYQIGIKSLKESYLA